MLNNDIYIKRLIRYLGNISQNDPDLFEEIRMEIIETTINSYPKRFQKRARGIQFILDHELSKHKHPVSRMNRMVEIFWEKFHEFNEVMNDPVGFTVEVEKNKNKGKVLQLH